MLIGIPIGFAVGFWWAKRGHGQLMSFSLVVAVLGWVLIIIAMPLISESFGVWDPVADRGRIPPGTSMGLGYIFGVAMGRVSTRKKGKNGHATNATAAQEPRAIEHQISSATSPTASPTKSLSQTTPSRALTGGLRQVEQGEAKNLTRKEEDVGTSQLNLEPYSAVAQELADGEIHQGLWLKARIETDGDEARTELVYAAMRVEQLALEIASARAKASALNSDDAENSASKSRVNANNKLEVAERMPLDAEAIRALEGELRGCAEYEVHLERAKQIVDSGIDVNCQDSAGRTALHIAISSGQERMAQWLLENGADPSIPDMNGITPETMNHTDRDENPESRERKLGAPRSIPAAKARRRHGITNYESREQLDTSRRNEAERVRELNRKWKARLDQPDGDRD